MKASAGAAKTSAAKFCNSATGIQRGSGNSGNTREPSSGTGEHPSPASRCPLVGACLALAKTFANINPPSRKYMKCRSSPQLFYPHLPGPICQKEGRSVNGIKFGFTIRRVHDVVCFAEYTNRVLRKDVDQENQEQVNRFISFDLCFQLMKSSVNS